MAPGNYWTKRLKHTERRGLPRSLLLPVWAHLPALSTCICVADWRVYFIVTFLLSFFIDFSLDFSYKPAESTYLSTFTFVSWPVFALHIDSCISLLYLLIFVRFSLIISLNFHASLLGQFTCPNLSGQVYLRLLLIDSGIFIVIFFYVYLFRFSLILSLNCYTNLLGHLTCPNLSTRVLPVFKLLIDAPTSFQSFLIIFFS